MKRFELWLKGILAAAISGGAGGGLHGFSPVGIDPKPFHFPSGTGAATEVAAGSGLISVGQTLLSVSVDIKTRNTATGKNACPTRTIHASCRIQRIQYRGTNHLAGALALERFAGQPVHGCGAAALRQFRVPQTATRAW